MLIPEEESIECSSLRSSIDATLKQNGEVKIPGYLAWSNCDLFEQAANQPLKVWSLKLKSFFIKFNTVQKIKVRNFYIIPSLIHDPCLYRSIYWLLGNIHLYTCMTSKTLFLVAGRSVPMIIRCYLFCDLIRILPPAQCQLAWTWNSDEISILQCSQHSSQT